MYRVVSFPTICCSVQKEMFINKFTIMNLLRLAIAAESVMHDLYQDSHLSTHATHYAHTLDLSIALMLIFKQI